MQLSKTVLMLIAFCLLVLVACAQKSSPAPERICNNLVKHGKINREDCTLDPVRTNYIPHYFSTGTATYDYVTTGLLGFERIRYSERGQAQVCDEGELFVRAEYIFGGSESVGFSFCDDILVGVSYRG